MSLVVSNPAARTQPDKSPDSTPRQPGNPAAPGNPAQTRQHPGNPATRPGNTRQPGNQGSNRTRPEKMPWRRCSGVHLAAPRCRRRPPAWPRHWARRQSKQQRKTGTYSALPVATRWPPLRRRPSWSHLSRRRARPSCRHMKADMILNQPGAWSAEPSGLLPVP